MVTFTSFLIRKKLAGGQQVTQSLLLRMAVPQETVSFGISVVDNEQVLSAGTQISFSSLWPADVWTVFSGGSAARRR